MSLSASVKKELDRINQQPGSSVALAAERTTGGTAALSVEVDWTKGPWEVGAYARYYADQSWEAVARVRRRLG